MASAFDAAAGGGFEGAGEDVRLAHAPMPIALPKVTAKMKVKRNFKLTPSIKI
jgi:hypothetical protein